MVRLIVILSLFLSSFASAQVLCVDYPHNPSCDGPLSGAPDSWIPISEIVLDREVLNAGINIPSGARRIRVEITGSENVPKIIFRFNDDNSNNYTFNLFYSALNGAGSGYVTTSNHGKIFVDSWWSSHNAYGHIEGSLLPGVSRVLVGNFATWAGVSSNIPNVVMTANAWLNTEDIVTKISFYSLNNSSATASIRLLVKY